MDDLLGFDETLSQEERLTRDSVRAFVDDNVIPIMASCFEEARFPLELIKPFAKLGVLGMTLPPEYGGAGASTVAYGLACQELERGDSAIRSFVSVQSALCMYPIYAFGSSEQKSHYLPLMAKGEKIGCFGLTEADAGSDPANMKTTAKKVDGGWRLNGSKLWITNATFADLAIVWAKTDADTVQGFIVEKGTPGFSTRDIKHKLSLRASATGEIILDDCFVPDENRLPGTEKGLMCALACLTKARLGIAFGAMGAAMACYDCALQYAKDRKQFNKPIGSFQLVQRSLVEMAAEIVKAQAINLQLARLQDAQKAHYAMVSLAKMNACKQALNIAREARNLLGANGISLEFPVIRHMNNLESVFTYEGTDNMHHLIVGRYLTGLNAFS